MPASSRAGAAADDMQRLLLPCTGCSCQGVCAECASQVSDLSHESHFASSTAASDLSGLRHFTADQCRHMRAQPHLYRFAPLLLLHTGGSHQRQLAWVRCDEAEHLHAPRKQCCRPAKDYIAEHKILRIISWLPEAVLQPTQLATLQLELPATDSSNGIVKDCTLPYAPQRQ